MNIIITGASKGIGLETIKLLCNQQHRVMAVSRSKIPFSHQNLIPLQGDIRDRNTIEYCKNYLTKNVLHLDILVNNAGYLINKEFEKINYSELIEVYEINVFAPFKWIQEFLPYMQSFGHAHIVNITSMGGITGTQKFSGLSAYSSSKAALSILTECLAEELKPYNIKCNGLALGAVQTEMLAQAFPGLKAPVSASEIAEFIVWFAINGPKYFNGKILPVALSTP